MASIVSVPTAKVGAAMPDVHDLLNKGKPVANLPDQLRPSNLPRMAVVSIRSGLRAYFAIYKVAGASETLAEDAAHAPAYEMFTQENHPDYLEAYTQTILQLYHGIELGIKELLRIKHPLLASSKLPDSAVLLCRILNKEVISFEDEETLKSTEFSQALQRVIALANASLLDGDQPVDADA
ncbi:MAG TPA: hypothetical protein VFC39_08245 [Acidobacteriaceae bacterium]|nr:hypothetical protein [Acidobacteriaceae bacterium]